MRTNSSWLSTALICFCCAFTPPQESNDVAELKRQVAALQKENETLKRENAQLKRDIETLRAAAEKTKKGIAPDNPFQVGMIWRGKSQKGMMLTIRLVSRKDDLAVFEAEGFVSGALFQVTGKVHGKLVQVDDIKRIKTPKGHDAIAMSKPAGTIRLSEDGSLSLDLSARVRSGSDSGEQGWDYEVQDAALQ